MVGKTLEERFYEKCIPEPNTGCWLWVGASNQAGYGQIEAHGREKKPTAFPHAVHSAVQLLTGL